MNLQKESFEFDLNTLYRLETTKRPSTSIAVYAELLAFTAIQNSSTIDCEVRFLCQTLKMGTHTVTETLNEFRRMGLVRLIPIKGRDHKRFIELVNEGDNQLAVCWLEAFIQREFQPTLYLTMRIVMLREWRFRRVISRCKLEEVAAQRVTTAVAKNVQGRDFLEYRVYSEGRTTRLSRPVCVPHKTKIPLTAPLTVLGEGASFSLRR